MSSTCDYCKRESKVLTKLTDIPNLRKLFKRLKDGDSVCCLCTKKARIVVDKVPKRVFYEVYQQRKKNKEATEEVNLSLVTDSANVKTKDVNGLSEVCTTKPRSSDESDINYSSEILLKNMKYVSTKGKDNVLNSVSASCTNKLSADQHIIQHSSEVGKETSTENKFQNKNVQSVLNNLDTWLYSDTRTKTEKAAANLKLRKIVNKNKRNPMATQKSVDKKMNVPNLSEASGVNLEERSPEHNELKNNSIKENVDIHKTQNQISSNISNNEGLNEAKLWDESSNVKMAENSLGIVVKDAFSISIEAFKQIQDERYIHKNMPNDAFISDMSHNKPVLEVERSENETLGSKLFGEIHKKRIEAKRNNNKSLCKRTDETNSNGNSSKRRKSIENKDCDAVEVMKLTQDNLHKFDSIVNDNIHANSQEQLLRYINTIKSNSFENISCCDTDLETNDNDYNITSVTIDDADRLHENVSVEPEAIAIYEEIMLKLAEMHKNNDDVAHKNVSNCGSVKSMGTKTNHKFSKKSDSKNSVSQKGKVISELILTQNITNAQVKHSVPENLISNNSQVHELDPCLKNADIPEIANNSSNLCFRQTDNSILNTNESTERGEALKNYIKIDEKSCDKEYKKQCSNSMSVSGDTLVQDSKRENNLMEVDLCDNNEHKTSSEADKARSEDLQIGLTSSNVNKDQENAAISEILQENMDTTREMDKNSSDVAMVMEVISNTTKKQHLPDTLNYAFGLLHNEQVYNENFITKIGPLPELSIKRLHWSIRCDAALESGVGHRCYKTMNTFTSPSCTIKNCKEGNLIFCFSAILTSGRMQIELNGQETHRILFGLSKDVWQDICCLLYSLGEYKFHNGRLDRENYPLQSSILDLIVKSAPRVGNLMLLYQKINSHKDIKLRSIHAARSCETWNNTNVASVEEFGLRPKTLRLIETSSKIHNDIVAVNRKIQKFESNIEILKQISESLDESNVEGKLVINEKIDLDKKLLEKSRIDLIKLLKKEELHKKEYS